MGSINSRKRNLLLNTVSSLTFQITGIICGFILPRLILHTYGSQVNGLINSITQFLSVISFLELGVGAVVQSSLYKPLADKDSVTISKIVVSADKFFRHIAEILLVYIVCLLVIYPYIANQNFGWVYTAGLIAAIGISSFSQYYFGVVDRLLLTADQHGYIQYNAQLITLVANTVACVIMINLGLSIHLVKLMTSIIYLARPIVLRIYVKKHYIINRKIKYEGEPITQKWNGAAQHIAAVILDGTDSIVLTIFSNLTNVSIYSVYHIVENGVKILFVSMTNGIQSLLGELWARQKIKELHAIFGWTEWIIHTGTVFVFGCTTTLIVPFVTVYTNGISDANYIQPLFALLITLAQAGHCLRLPYNLMILAGGHYKQTQHNYIISALLNIIISIATVKFFGLVGVAIGTLVAMAYQTVWMARYVSINLIKWPFSTFLKQIIIDFVTFFIGWFLISKIKMQGVTYYDWVILAIIHSFLWLILILLINVFLKPVFLKKSILGLNSKIKKMIKKKEM